jgi:hypothetical protein
MLKLSPPPEEKTTWVEIEVQKGTASISVYRGRMLDDDVASWLETGAFRSPDAKLFDTYWSYDEGDGAEGWVAVGSTPGPYGHAVGVVFIRADAVLVVLPLRDGREHAMHSAAGPANRNPL